MPCTCAVAVCKNTSDSKENRPEIIHHVFPVNNVALCKIWIQFCKRKDKINPKTARICSEHFLESDYNRDLRNELLGLPTRRRLKLDASPSLFHTSDKRSSSMREKRVEQRARKALVTEILSESQYQPVPSLDECENMIHDELFTCDMDTQTDAKLMDEVITLRKNVSRKNNVIQRLKSENTSLRRRLQKLKATNINCSSTATGNQFSCFSPTQIKKLNGKRVFWTTPDIVRALSVRSLGLKAYESAQKVWKLPLPSSRTLRRWTSNFSCSPGLLKEVLEIMKVLGASMSKLSKICVISFDEMNISSLHVYDKTEDCITSSSKVQVIMLRGICDKWKQPIYFGFDIPITKELLFEVIEAIEGAGFFVHGITSDLGPENRGLWKSLGIGVDNCKFKNPVKHRDVYVFADVPHMLKLIRNHILDDGIQLPSGFRIEHSMFEDLVQHDEKELKLCPKFNRKHIMLQGAERMRVRPAAQMLSNHVAALAKVVYPESNEIHNFIKLINDGFDVLNSRVPWDEKYASKSAYGMDLQRQNMVLDELKFLMLNGRFLLTDKSTGAKKMKTALLPCQIGFAVSINSTRELFQDLQALYGVNYILTSRLNQDCLESLFSTVRSFGGSNLNPTPVEFKYRLRLILLGSRLRSPRNTNIEYDDEEDSYTMSAGLIQKNKLRDSKLSEDPIQSYWSNPPTMRTRSKAMNEDKESLSYLAGFIAWKLKRQGETCYGSLTPTGVNGSWISILSRGGLLTPNEQINEWVENCNAIFNSYAQEHTYRKGLSTIVSKLILNSYPDMDPNVVNEFLKIRIKIRISYMNNIRKARSYSAINRKKAKQFIASKKQK